MALDVSVSTYPRNMLEPAVAGSGFKLPVNLKASTTFVRGMAIADSTASPGTFAPYNSGGSDNEANPTAVMPVNCSTDASGNITVGSNSDPAGRTTKAIDVWFGGIFNASDLVKAASTPLDATCAGKLGKLIKGTLTNGLVWVR